MRADSPVQGREDGLEVSEERDSAFELGELAGGNGEETGIVESTVGGPLALEFSLQVRMGRAYEVRA